MADNFKYTAFISYSHADKAVVEKLHKALERFKIPKGLVGQVTAKGKIPAKFKPFFRDRDDLSAATNLSASIKKAMMQSEH
ncbi:MAG: toll/interleukin-1 receptor domain-containing protein, partial [Sphingomonadales bacterium]